MKLIILHFLDIQAKKNIALVESLSVAAANSGHQVDVVDGIRPTDCLRLAPYEYVVVVSPSLGFIKGRVHPRVVEVLSSCGNLTGKKGAALVTKSLFSAAAANHVLMRVMEREGMVVNDFNILENPRQAAAVGSRLG